LLHLFMLGAVFGKVIEPSGISKSIVSAVIGVLGRDRAVLSIVAVCAILSYGGVSLFVVVFAVYPFAAVAPSGIIATASFAETVCMAGYPLGMRKTILEPVRRKNCT
jgi:H+/gluconate symporter-like permease